MQKKIIKGWHVRRRDPDNVMKEIINLTHTCPNLEEIVFSDSVFTWGYNWLKEFLKEFKRMGLSFRCFGHFSLMKPKVLELIGKSGCHMITAGIQGSERIRKKYFNKHETDEQIIEGSKLIASLGILGRYDVLTNIPYSTKEDDESVGNLLSNLKRPFSLREFPLLYNPKTELTKRCLKDKIITENDIEGIAATAYKKWGKFTYYATD
ncbi:MAG: radical SAM protein [Candidatus Hodarchaeota archaeon]